MEDKPTSIKTVLVISSQTAASRVGAGASVFCLEALGHNCMTLPTTLFGRHPGWGEPGGGAIPANHLKNMWDAITKQGLTFDAVLTGYMADPEQISQSVDIINQLKTANPGVIVMVDPVMGDNGALYVSTEVAGAMLDTLVPLADYITPNMWEFSVIANAPQNSARQIYTSAKAMPATVIVTSVRTQDSIGAMLIERQTAYLVKHDKIDHPPHGGGDAFAGLLLGHILSNLPARDALAHAGGTIAQIMAGFDHTSDKGELPLVRLQHSITQAPALKLQHLKQTPST